MKSLIFSRAWEFYKMYDISFGHALRDAWKLYKRELLKAEFAQTSSEEVTYRAKLVAKFNELKPNTYLNKLREVAPIDNSNSKNLTAQWFKLDEMERKTQTGSYAKFRSGFENYSFNN